MEKKHQFAMLASIMHIVNGDWGSLVKDLTLMDVVRPGSNLRRVTMVFQLDELSYFSTNIYLSFQIKYF